MERIAHGIFTWDGSERRSVRYGSFFLSAKNFDESVSVVPVYSIDALMPFEDKKVRITAVVIESRKSGHRGDLSLEILPSEPEVGEIIDLGVGVFELSPAYDSSPSYTLRPGDGRSQLWIDPRKLYRLHDQTVDLFIEVTTDDFTPAPDLSIPPAGYVVLPDGSFQMCGVTDEEEMRALAQRSTFQRIGDPSDHLFIIGPPLPGRYEKDKLS